MRIDLLERPVDWLSANGFVSRPEEWEAYFEVDRKLMKRLGRKYQHETGCKLSQAYDAIARALKFDDYNHFRTHMERKNEWRPNRLRAQEKAVIKAARRQAWLLSKRLGI